MADITIDGKPVGSTPLCLDNLLVGHHTIKLSKSGYNDYTQILTITEGQTTTVSATLTKHPVPTPKPTSTTTSSSSTNFGGFEMVYVKGGTFTMGRSTAQDPDALDREKPTHTVALSDFYIGKYEVTQAQWRAIMGSNPSHFTGDNNPVEQVSWEDVQKFIKKLNKKTGKKFRLPTEAEWEYAARGGNKRKNYKYSGSDNIFVVAWYNVATTHSVGLMRPNDLGIYDMSGNVWEWCQDWYGSYSGSHQENPTGPSNGSSRVLRGGCWSNAAKYCRVTNRGGDNPANRRNFVGFRLACSAE
jgi:formylglycine-generating enzyme required for sulfatase activity